MMYFDSTNHERSQACSAMPTSANEGKNEKKDQRMQKVPDAIIQHIVRDFKVKCAKEINGKRALQNILEGKNGINTALARLAPPDCEPLPLSEEEQTHLKRLLKQCPVSIEQLTLMDVLGFTAYLALSTLSQEAHQDKDRALYLALEAIKKNFCRYWLEAVVSVVRGGDKHAEFHEKIEQLMRKLCARSEEHHQQKNKKYYDDSLQTFSILLQMWNSDVPYLQNSTCNHVKFLFKWMPKSEKNPQRLMEGIQTFIDFVICAFENTTYMQAGTDKITPELYKLKTTYDFIYQAFQVPGFVENEDLSPELLSQVITAQKSMLATFFDAYDRYQVQDKERMLLSEKKPFKGLFFHKGDDIGKCDSIRIFSHFYFEYVWSIIQFLDMYAKQTIPSYVPLEVTLMRTGMLCRLVASQVQAIDKSRSSQYFHQEMMKKRYTQGQACYPRSGYFSDPSLRELDWIEQALYQSAPNTLEPCEKTFLKNKINVCRKQFLEAKPETPLTTNLYPLELNWIIERWHKEASILCSITEMMPFLSRSQHNGFAELSILINQEIQQLTFTINKEFVQLAKQEFSKELEVRLWRSRDYKPLYLAVTSFLEASYPLLERLEKKHSEKLIHLIESLPLETCITHQEAILNYFEKFLMENMVTFSTMAIFKQNLEVLLLELNGDSTASFAETPIMSYLLMWDFEKYFSNRVNPISEPTHGFDDNGLLTPTERLEYVESSLFLEEEDFELATDEKSVNLLERTHVESSKGKIKAVAASKVKKKETLPTVNIFVRPETSALKTTTANSTADEPRKSPFQLRRNIKLRNLIKQLKDLGLDWARQKGSHARYKKGKAGVTVPEHGDRHSVGQGVLNKLQKQVTKLQLLNSGKLEK